MAAPGLTAVRTVPVGRRTVRWVLAALLMFVPMGVLALGPWPTNPFLVYLGTLPALVALREGRAVAPVTVLATPVAVGLGVLASGSPWLGTLYLTALAVSVSWSWSRGWPGAGTYVVTQAAVATISPPAGLLAGSVPSGPALPSPLGLLTVLVGGAWVLLVARVLLSDLPAADHAAPDRTTLARHAVLLGVLVGVATAVTMSLPAGLHAWWVVLSLLVIVQPDPVRTTRRALERVLGTVVGGAGAAVVLLVAGRSPATTVLGVLLAIGSAVAYLKASYWVFTTLLTAALVLLTFAPGTVVRGEAERIGFTVVAALAVLVVGVVERRVGLLRARAGGRG